MTASNLVTTAIATGGTKSFDIATCIGGYKEDPFTVFNSTGIIYYHDMLQTKTEYQALNLNKTMQNYDASTAPNGAKPERSPFADDASAYFVGDDNFQDAGHGLLRFRRKFSRIPSNYNEPYGLYSRVLPSITASVFFDYYDPLAGSGADERDDTQADNPLLADDCNLSYFFGTPSELETAGDSFTGMTADFSFDGDDDNDFQGHHIFSSTGTTFDGTLNYNNTSGLGRGFVNRSSRNINTIDNMHYRARFQGKLNISSTNGATPHTWVDESGGGVYLDVGFKCAIILGQTINPASSTNGLAINFDTSVDNFGNGEGHAGLCTVLKRRQDAIMTVHHCSELNNLRITSIDRSTGEFTAISDIRSDLVDHYKNGLRTGDTSLEKFYINLGDAGFSTLQSHQHNQSLKNDIDYWRGSCFRIRGIGFSTGQTRAFSAHKNMPARVSYRFVKSDNLDSLSLKGNLVYPLAITADSTPNNQTWAGYVATNFFPAENEFIERYQGNIYRIGQIETRLE